MAELRNTFKWLYRRTVNVLARLRGRPASLPQRQSSPSNEPISPTTVDLPSLPSPEVPPPARDDAPITSIQTSPSETLPPPAPVSGAAFEGVTLPLPEVIESDAKPPEPVSRNERRSISRNPSLVVYALGHFRVYCDDRLITTWRSKKGKAIFKYLLAQREHQATKDILMDVFWPDASPEAARNNLNVAVHGLRQAIKAVRPDQPFIMYEDEHYVINPAIELWVDFEEYVNHYEAAVKLEKEGEVTRALREYERAESLYRGDFLEEDLYEEWTVLTRERVRSTLMDILDHLAGIHFAEEKYDTCVGVCRRILSRDRCREDAHRLLMRCYSRKDQVPLALRQYQACRQALHDELDVSPTAATIQLCDRIRHGERV